MKKILLTASVLAMGFSAQAIELDKSVMSNAFWKVWNDEALAKIDADIEKYRKADGSFSVPGVKAGTDIKVEQLSHAFYFGANIFNYNQLGSTERNNKYKELFGTVFNSATVAFYWLDVEPTQGSFRFAETYWDSEEYWNTCKDPSSKRFWRRPPVDPVIAFCKQRGIRIHGHPLSWGDIGHAPKWLWDEFCPDEEKFALEQASGIKVPTWDWRQRILAKPRGWRDAWRAIHKKMSQEEIAKLVPTYLKNYEQFVEKRIREIGERYGSRVDSWDVINESAQDFKGNSCAAEPYCRSDRYGVLPANFPYRSFKLAEQYLPQKALLNINDYAMTQQYVNQIQDLKKKGAKIDVVGSQMHLFNPRESANIAAGKLPAHITPKGVESRFNGLLSKAGRPIHLSEITITAPGRTQKDEMIQAIILNCMYRAWFSQKDMMGISWWNLVDDCGAYGEPSISGLFTRDMKPKLAFLELRDLITKTWHTSLIVKADEKGTVSFRGFRGKYRLTWKGADGKPVSKIVELK